MKYTIIDNAIRYTVVPPKMRIIYEDNSPRARLDRYLKEMDKEIDGEVEGAEGESPRAKPADDIVSLLFDQQARSKEQKSRHMAAIIQERCDLAKKHLDEIGFKIYDLMEQKPFVAKGWGPVPDGKLTDLEKAINNLQKEKRETEAALWRDVNELRMNMLIERQDYKAVTRRMNVLTGEFYHAA